MKTKSILSLALMFLVLSLTTFSCKKDSSSGTSSNDSNVPEGAIDAPFSVSEHRQVYFSKGNLQYKASTNTWRFAENQYDFIGEDNSNISANFSGWIDMFGWGTSGYDHGAVCYQPWSTNDDKKNYYAYGSSTKNLYDNTGKADWGYNAISNGGNTENQWRTLTKNEWEYIINNRNTVSGIRYAKAQIYATNGRIINGLLLLPDDWDPDVFFLNETNTYNSNFYSNVISATNWVNTIEANGAVFLPAAGFFTTGQVAKGVNTIEANVAVFLPAANCVYVYDIGYGGHYWLPSYYDKLDAETLFFDDEALSLGRDFRNRGLSVRLVQDIEE